MNVKKEQKGENGFSFVFGGRKSGLDNPYVSKCVVFCQSVRAKLYSD